MYNIAANEQRNTEAALLDSYTLYSVNLYGVYDVQYRANIALGNLARELIASRHLIHLTNLLLKGHLGQQLLNLAVDFIAGGCCTARCEQRTKN